MLSPALIVIDEANKLMRWDEGNPEELRSLLDFFVKVSKQDATAHVVLATSDNFLPVWLETSALRRSLCIPSPPPNRVLVMQQDVMICTG